MNKLLDPTQSTEIARKIKSKAKKPFDNAYKAALEIPGAKYVQGFLVYPGTPYQPIEHAWVEVISSKGTNSTETDSTTTNSTATEEDKPSIRIIDPTFPHFNQDAERIWYFAAHAITIKELKAIIEESQEDYPEDDPLPIYGDAPYEYYGDVMLGGKNYLAAYENAMSKSQEINRPIIDSN